MSAAAKWNEKFSHENYFYGEEPNTFLKLHIDSLNMPYEILFLGEGEGRNATYAAKKGFNVFALDASDVAIKKTDALAAKNGVKVETIHKDLNDWIPNSEYDRIMCSFLHLNEPLRTLTFMRVIDALKPSGEFVGEFFSTKQLNYNSGGPSHVDFLYTTDSLEKIFSQFSCKILELKELVDNLDEGIGHQGDASLIRILIKKI